MSADGTLGALLQGVSQQPEAVRPSGKVSEQINFNSDIVQGLISRPALVGDGYSELHTNAYYGFLNVEVEGQPYVLGCRDRQLYMWDEAGNQMTVEYDNSAARDYINTRMRPHVYEDSLFLVNRNITVRKSSATDGAISKRRGLAFCLGGKFDREYSITISLEGSSRTARASYTTPDGTNEGDADKTSAVNIMNELYNELMDKADDDFNFSLRGNVMFFENSDFDVHVQASDGDDNSTLRAFTNRVRGVEDLPEYATNNFLVRVTNSDGGDQDDFYLRFKPDDPNSTWGGSGTWEEWRNPEQRHSFDLSTMPHVLRKTGTNTFRLYQGNWLSRRTGDDETNPFPDLVDHKIRDIAGFQSRLVFVAGPYLIMSRTREPYDLFKKSALAEIDTDPISVSSTQAGTVRLDWIVPFDRDLVLLSDPGEGQFIVTGQSKITPSNASMSKTTSFEIKGNAKPVETGKTILFPFHSGKYSGIQEFFTNDEVATNGADTLTETLDQYIVGSVDHMAVNKNFNIAVFKTTDTSQNGIVYVYKYLWQGNEKVQSAWSKWKLPREVEHFYFKGSALKVIMSERHVDGEHRNFIFADIDLDIPDNPDVNYPVCLDWQATHKTNSDNEVLVHYEDGSFCQGKGCLTPGRPVSPVEVRGKFPSGNVYYRFDPATVPPGAEVICGIKYNRLLKPTPPFLRDQNGAVRARTRLTVTTFLIHYENTGYIKSSMQSRYRAAPVEFVADWFPMDNDPEDPTGTGLRSGRLSVPYGERTDWSEWTITSDDIRPTNFLEIEWVGHAYKGGR